MNIHDENCACCKFNHPFEIPENLIEEIQAGNCVIFAGAGVSTESPKVLNWSFYDEISKEVGGPKNLSFPETMSLFTEQPSGRMKLIEKILARFKNIDNWADLRNRATAFHTELGTMPYLSRVVTTNWDTYFEKYASMRPFVYDADIAFWDASPRSVLKLHGSVENLSTIVATLEDYDNCFKRLNEGLLGTILKQILATKTCIFIGYSLKDDDLRKILDSVGGQLGQFQKTHYFVTPFYTEGDLDGINIDASPIITDGTYFLSQVKAEMVERFCYADDQAYDAVDEMLYYASDIHCNFVEEYSVVDHPVVLCNISYQDGIIHALQRIVDLRSSGVYSDLHDLQSLMIRYYKIANDKKKKKAYIDHSYFMGYRNGLMAFFSATSNFQNMIDIDLGADEDDGSDDTDEDYGVPMFFHPKLEELSKKEYFSQVVLKPKVHKGALRECINSVKVNGYKKGYIPQRMPFM